MSLAKKVWHLLLRKGMELRSNPNFSEVEWDDYVLSIGCETAQCEASNFGGYEEEKSVVVRDENHTAFGNKRGQIPRCLRIDKETAMKIAILGLP
jgi:hypothetical protein